METWYRWAAAQGGGLEHLELAVTAAGVEASGVVIGDDDGAAFGCAYTIRCDARWHVRSVEVRLAGAGALVLEGDGAGNWRDAGGNRVAALAGCIDVDLACTPFTNTLPIRRLGPGLAQRQEIEVAYIGVARGLPCPEVRPARQAYTCVAPRRYRFESLSEPFSAELETDGDGLVLRYPGLFGRVSGPAVSPIVSPGR